MGGGLCIMLHLQKPLSDVIPLKHHASKMAVNSTPLWLALAKNVSHNPAFSRCHVSLRDRLWWIVPVSILCLADSGLIFSHQRCVGEVMYGARREIEVFPISWRYRAAETIRELDST